MMSAAVMSATIETVTHPRGATAFGLVRATVEGRRWFLLIEIEDNKSTSVTNCSEEAVAHALDLAGDDGTRRRETHRYFEAYEYRMRAHGMVDPSVMEIIYPGGVWRPVSDADKAALRPLFAHWIEING